MNSYEPASPPWRRSVGTSAGSVSGRRLLLVLAVVAGAPLAPHEPEDGGDDEERRDGREAEHDEAGPKRMSLQRVDPLVVALVAVGVRSLLLEDAIERVALARRACPPSTRRRSAGSASAARRTDGRGPRRLGASRACPTSSTSPRTHTGLPHARRIFPGGRLDADEAVERLVPLVAPDLEFTSTTSSYATATPRSVYETVNARVWSFASKYQTMRARVAASLDAERARVPPARVAVSLPRVNAMPRSATEGLTSDSPVRRGMSR